MKYEIKLETSFDVEGQLDSIKVSSECEYSYSPTEQIISYDEQLEDGKVPTKIIVHSDCVDILREHPAMPDMHMKLGEVVEASIDTPYGSIPTTCTTNRVSAHMDPSGGSILLDYVMDIGGACSKNRVAILIREK